MTARSPLRAAAGAACALSLALGAVAMAALATGQIASDRWRWSQALFWMPGAIPVTIGFAGSLLGLLIAWRCRLGGARRWALALAGASVVAAVWVGTAQWRLHNLLRRAAPPAGAISILGWNATDVSSETFRSAVTARRPDVLVAINPPLSLDWIAFAGDLWGLTAEQAAHQVRAGGRVVIASRYEPASSSATGLGLRGVVAGSPEQRIDPGQAVFATLDIDGAPLTVWAIDLPSDPALSRAAMARRAREAIDGSSHTSHMLAESGAYYESRDSTGFPAPDVIVGDFNTTRGAASLAPLVGPLADAHARAGAGPDGTWPRPWWLLGLDQAFVRQGLRIWRYDVFDAGAGSHRMQQFWIESPAP